jgi:HAD superfamily hydrolase (TIGR01484 family)
MKKPRIVFSDFDGTLTEQGMISPVLFQVLDLIYQLNSELIVVTGRPVSWSHFLMSHLPLGASISEGGGVITLREGKRLRDIVLAPESDLINLKNATSMLFEKILGFELSDDSSCRITDRAIDLNFLHEGDRGPKILSILDSFKLHYSKSSVHLNFWSGDISKMNGVNYFLKNYSKVDLEDCIYFGDSLNDESAFKDFKFSVGVSNISKVLDKITHKPSEILYGDKNKEILGVKSYLKKIPPEISQTKHKINII